MPTQPGNPKMSCDIALTVTFKAINHLTSLEQYKAMVPLYMKKMAVTKHTSVVELTQNFDIHIHAIVQVRLDKLGTSYVEAYLRNLLRDRNIGFLCVKQMTDAGWIDYIFKDVDKTARELAELIVFNDDFNHHEEYVLHNRQFVTIGTTL